MPHQSGFTPKRRQKYSTKNNSVNQLRQNCYKRSADCLPLKHKKTSGIETKHVYNKRPDLNRTDKDRAPLCLKASAHQEIHTRNLVTSKQRCQILKPIFDCLRIGPKPPTNGLANRQKNQWHNRTAHKTTPHKVAKHLTCLRPRFWPQKAPTTQMKIADEPLIPGGSSATRRATGKPCLKRE